MSSKKEQKTNQVVHSKAPRILAIDLVRIIVIAAVIATHIMATGPLYDSPTSGAIWMISHTSRNVFVLLSALVLMYSYRNRPLKIGQFYLKRFLLILLPYTVWTAIYQIGDGIQQQSLNEFMNVFLHNLFTAGAMYHLYFLLITMQLYLLFPILRYLYRKVKQYPWRIFWVSLGVQLLMTAIMQYGTGVYGLNWWLNNPDNYILGYQFYIVGGMLIASHLQLFEQLVSRYRRQLYASSLVVAGVGLALYFAQTSAGSAPHIAAAVFQPYLVIESLVFGLALFALGTSWVERGTPAKRTVDAIAQDSFGIYLCHILFINHFIKMFQPDIDSWGVALLTLAIGLPITYLVSFIFIEVMRHTWISVFVTGRHYAALTVFSRRKSKLDPALV